MMIYLIYQILIALVILLALPLLPILLLLPKIRRGLPQRLGILPKRVRHSAVMAERRIWIHAASVGEVNAMVEMARELLSILPSVGMVVTCTTATGVAQAKRRLPEAVAHLLMPLDLPLFLDPVLQWFKPSLAMVIETELWPGFIHRLAMQGCVVMVANGRMSERSARRYSWLAPLFRETLRRVHTVATQSASDAQRFIALGANAQRVVVAGNTKFDLKSVIAEGQKKGPGLKSSLGLQEEQWLIVAGSTRSGDEEGMLKAFVRLRERFKNAVLLLAPRHLERLGEVRALVEKHGLTVCSRQGLSQGRGQGREVILLDTLGELAWMYAGADLAWIGGSWGKDGGQNPLEAACHSMPVVFGPSMHHFSEAASFLIQREAALQLNSFAELASASEKILENKSVRKAMGLRAGSVLQQRAGASRRVAELASKVLMISDMKSHGEDWRAESLRRDATVSEFGDSLDNLHDPDF